MDFSKIKLENERSEHVIKRLNRLSTWKFFGVLYREPMRMHGFGLLMLICIAPIVAMQMLSGQKIAEIQSILPFLNGFGFSTGIWTGASDYFAKVTMQYTVQYGLLTVAASLLMFVMFSGGFAVIRDGFWTGKVSIVGVLKSMWMGIRANCGYAAISTIVVSFGVFGVFMFYLWAETVMPLWLVIILTVLLGLVMLLIACYFMILCSVSVTYKESVGQTLADSWRLLWLNFLPNILNLVIALLPVILYFVLKSGSLLIMYLVVLAMFGGFVFPLVWQAHMMRTFALFHPVESRKKKDVEREIRERQEAEARARNEAKQAAAAKKTNRKGASKKNAQQQVPAQAQVPAAAEAPAQVAEQPIEDELN